MVEVDEDDELIIIGQVHLMYLLLEVDHLLDEIDVQMTQLLDDLELQVDIELVVHIEQLELILQDNEQIILLLLLEVMDEKDEMDDYL
tara:strand:- start:395 stop:658 length:264 start_codon:yes stop_codon:yes gene_type:complete